MQAGVLNDNTERERETRRREGEKGRGTGPYTSVHRKAAAEVSLEKYGRELPEPLATSNR